MSKIKSCNHDPDFTICTECQKVNRIVELGAQLETSEEHLNDCINIISEQRQTLEEVRNLTRYEWSDTLEDYIPNNNGKCVSYEKLQAALDS